MSRNHSFERSPDIKGIKTFPDSDTHLSIPFERSPDIKGIKTFVPLSVIPYSVHLNVALISKGLRLLFIL